MYRVVLTSNGKYRKTLYKCLKRDNAFIHFHSMKEENKKIMFPKKFINNNGIKPVEFKICLVKPTEPTDTFRKLRDRYGKTYIEKPLGDWTIIDSDDFKVEETFWIFGRDPAKERPTIHEIVKILMNNVRKKNNVKQIIVVHNKFIVYNEDQFDMVICKCIDDAQRLHHTLSKIANRQRLNNLLFMGTATQATISKLYPMIQEKTNWPIKKVRRADTFN